MASLRKSAQRQEDQRQATAQLVNACETLMKLIAALESEKKIPSGELAATSQAVREGRIAIDRAKEAWGDKEVAWYPDLLEAAQAVVSILGDEDLPDNGELSGAAVTDMLRASVDMAKGEMK